MENDIYTQLETEVKQAENLYTAIKTELLNVTGRLTRDAKMVESIIARSFYFNEEVTESMINDGFDMGDTKNLVYLKVASDLMDEMGISY